MNKEQTKLLKEGLKEKTIKIKVKEPWINMLGDKVKEINIPASEALQLVIDCLNLKYIYKEETPAKLVKSKNEQRTKQSS